MPGSSETTPPFSPISPRQSPSPRIVVVGVTGSGKTTMSRDLSRILNIPCIELDAIHWQPNWVMMETDAFRQKVSELTEVDAWVVDGNYSKARDIVWGRATTMIWLDYPYLVSLAQLFSRSIRRLLKHEVLWNSNMEDWKSLFFSKDSLFLWYAQSYPKMKKTYPALLAQPEYSHLQLIRLRSRKDTTRFLRAVEGVRGEIRG